MLTITEKYRGNLEESERALARGDHDRAWFHLNVAARQMRTHRAQIAESFKRTRERRPWLDEEMSK